MRTALICTASPTAFVALADVKKQLRVTSTTDDDAITALIAVACAALEGADGLLKRAIGDQTWKLVLPRFLEHRHLRGHYRSCLRGDPARPWNAVPLPLPPVKTISQIQYYDSENVQQTLDSASYSLVDCGTEPAFAIPAESWPGTYCRPDAISITFTAGYGAGNIPAPISGAVYMMVRQLYDLGARNVFITSDTVFGVGSKSYAVSEVAGQIIQGVVDRLLFNYRIVGL